MLGREGVRSLVLERGPHVASSWRARYDGFRLNTSSWFSYLPGQRFARQAGRWPSREALVAYYESYAERHGVTLRTDTPVEHVERTASGWELTTSDGRLQARFVVVATGKYRTPVIPQWPGGDGFTGQLVHSADYRNAHPYRGQDVLVVGPGNSGFEIAVQLHEGGAQRVWLSIRTPPHVIHRDIGPFPSDVFAVLGRHLPPGVVDWASERIRRRAIGDLSVYELQPPPDGLYERLRRTGMIPTIDGRFIDALKRQEVQVVAAVERFRGGQVVLADGSAIAPDAVIAATGYHRDLEPLVGHLGVLTGDGHPLVHGATTHPQAPGLYFIGFSEPLSGNLREIRFDARKIARAIRRAIGPRTSPRSDPSAITVRWPR
jgi:cation diffusion facilitator CzcD-associated flavoprotein CzcO